jgi:hypothetical protein
MWPPGVPERFLLSGPIASPPRFIASGGKIAHENRISTTPSLMRFVNAFMVSSPILLLQD